MDALALQLILGRAKDLSAQRLRAALAQAGHAHPDLDSLRCLLGEPPARLQRLGLPPAASAWLHAPDASLIEADRAWVARERIVLLDAFAEQYPPLLAQISGAPAVLYVRGDAAVLREPQVAIVGTRGPTIPGRHTATQFALALSRAGLTITSGLALGIDAAAHEGALAAGGRTIAVLGCGLDQLYPPQHGLLAARIAAHGAVLSEFPRGAGPLRAHFGRRNRLISGLSLGALIVEAAHHSGSLITARLARRQGRAVFAVPGSIRNPLVRGCHALIRDGATLVETPQDVLEKIRGSSHKQEPMPAHGRPAAPPGTPVPLDKGHKILLDALGFESASVDTLVERTGFPSHSVASMLLILELAGAIGSQAGGRYVRL